MTELMEAVAKAVAATTVCDPHTWPEAHGDAERGRMLYADQHWQAHTPEARAAIEAVFAWLAALAAKDRLATRQPNTG